MFSRVGMLFCMFFVISEKKIPKNSPAKTTVVGTPQKKLPYIYIYILGPISNAWKEVEVVNRVVTRSQAHSTRAVTRSQAHSTRAVSRSQAHSTRAVSRSQAHATHGDLGPNSENLTKKCSKTTFLGLSVTFSWRKTFCSGKLILTFFSGFYVFWSKTWFLTTFLSPEAIFTSKKIISKNHFGFFFWGVRFSPIFQGFFVDFLVSGAKQGPEAKKYQKPKNEGGKKKL